MLRSGMDDKAFDGLLGCVGSEWMAVCPHGSLS